MKDRNVVLNRRVSNEMVFRVRVTARRDNQLEQIEIFAFVRRFYRGHKRAVFFTSTKNTAVVAFGH